MFLLFPKFPVLSPFRISRLCCCFRGPLLLAAEPALPLQCTRQAAPGSPICLRAPGKRRPGGRRSLHQRRREPVWPAARAQASRLPRAADGGDWSRCEPGGTEELRAADGDRSRVVLLALHHQSA
ncbi:hypothetical protein PAHAL_8G080000 [Panicum hallii]|uniref:Uncharacterized protein n=1 Tax=Panicum hallii TaxID=206008 RepID=A0A2T8I858_9POAL|nr:hypothetical protein PAHAL_8G080000 [Panicum hallii]